MVWPFSPHFLQVVCGHQAVSWPTSHCWQNKQKSSKAILVKRVLCTSTTQLSEIVILILISCLICAIEVNRLKVWSSGSFSWWELEIIIVFFLLTKPHVCFGKYDNYIKGHTLGLSHATYRTFFDCKLRSRGLRNMKFLKLLLKSDSRLSKWSSLIFA